MNAVSLTSGMRQNLFSLQRTSNLFAINANRLTTGKKVNSALDDPVNFFTSIQHMNRARDLMARQSEMGEGVQTIQAASTGIDSMLDLIESAEALARSALSAETSAEKEILANQYNETLNQMNGIANDASYKGTGLLRCPPESLCVNFDESGDSSLTIEGECASAGGLGISSVQDSSTGETSETTENIEKSGIEFQVNTNTANDQTNAVVTGLSDGGFLVIWESDHDPANWTFGDIYGQRYDSLGNEIGEEFKVNTDGLLHQSNPSVASFSDGGFVVTWEDTLSGTKIVCAQIYDSTANEVGEAFRVNQFVLGSQYQQSVASLSDGGFVVTWTSHHTNDNRVFGQIYDTAGNKVYNHEFQINTNTNNSQWQSSVIGLSDGGFVVTWTSDHETVNDSNVYAQRYDSNGIMIDGEFIVNTHTDSNQWDQSVIGLSDGGFVVTWESDHDNSLESWDVYGQKYDSSGNEVGGEFHINTDRGAETESSVTKCSDGGFVVTWSYNSWSGPNTSIYAQRYDNDGNKTGSEFQVRQTTEDSLGRADIVTLSDGTFIVTWTSEQTGDSRIYGQRCAVPSTPSDPVVTASNWDSSFNINTSLDELAAAKQRLRTLQSKFSNNLNIITTRSSFTDSMVNILETGAGNLTNADMNEEGATALMLQTRQSLGSTSLSMASQAAQSVLRLF